MALALVASIAPSTTAMAPATAAATPTTAIVSFARFVDRQGPPVLDDAVQGVDGGLGILLAREVHEGEAARLTGHAIGHHVDLDYVPAAIGAQAPQCFFVGIEREIADVNPSSHC
jgi:hypothetical protein